MKKNATILAKSALGLVKYKIQLHQMYLMIIPQGNHWISERIDGNEMIFFKADGSIGRI